MALSCDMRCIIKLLFVATLVIACVALLLGEHIVDAPPPLQATNTATLNDFQTFVHQLTADHALLPKYGFGEMRTFRFHATAWRPIDSTSYIPRFGVPILNGHVLLERMLDSLDIHIGEVVIVWSIMRSNIGLRWAREIFQVLSRKLFLHPERDITIHVVEGNLGVASAWNLILQPLTDMPFVFFCSHDIAFTKGYLQSLVRFVNDHPEFPMFLSSSGYCFFILRPSAVKKTGNFDENIWPAYCEDCEHISRLLLSGYKLTTLPGEYKHEYLHGFITGSSTLISDMFLRASIQSAQHVNCDYVRRKWNFTNRVQDNCGAQPGSGGHPYPFYRPFNNHSAPIGYWTIDWPRRAGLAGRFAYTIRGTFATRTPKKQEP